MIDRICQTIGQEKKRQKTTQKAAQELQEMHFYFSHISESQKRESSKKKTSMAKAVVDQMKNAILLWSCQSNSSKRHFWWVNLHLLHVPDLLGQDEKYYAPISHSQGMFQEAIPKALMLPYWQERRAQQSHFGMGNTLLKHHGITILQSDQLYFLLCQKKTHASSKQRVLPQKRSLS